MKYCLFLNKISLIFLFVSYFICLNSISAQDIKKSSFEEMTKKLRCMTCQNQSIYDSDTEFAKDIKKIIKEKLDEGKSQKEILDFLVIRYGEYILFEPRFNKKNIFLWVFPFFILSISAIFLLININKNRNSK